MLKTIKKFIVERRRLVRQRRQQVIGEPNSGDASSQSGVPPPREGENGDPCHPEIPPQVAEPQLDEPAAPMVWGKLKWYNSEKRYGFVELSDGSGDAFLHASALAGISIGALQPGVTLEFRTTAAQRGLQVTEVISVDSSAAAQPRLPRKNLRSPSDRQPLEASVQEMGTVKWYNAAKGFGFIVLDSGGNDVFVHVSALQRASIVGLSEGQRVFVGIAEGRKGPEAASIQLA